MYKTFPHLFVLLLAFLLTVPYDLTAKPFEIPRSEIVELEDSKTKRVYPIYIKLPPSYHRMANNRYPVIYITDANYAFQIISGATRFPMNSGKMQQAILVGISYSKDSRGDRSRIRDFTPVYAKSWKKTTGEAENHMRFIREQVFNFIDNHYRTAPDKRIFVGNSLGGLFGAYIFLNQPDMFESYVLGSPSFWFNDGVIFDIEKQSKIKDTQIKNRIFIGIGERETSKLDGRYDMVEQAQAFHDRLDKWQQPNLDLKMLTIKEANHDTAFPTTAIQGLYWLLRK